MRMEILYLVERLEKLLGKGKRLPLSSGVLIDGEECREIIDQLRVAIPQEIREARRVQEEREKLIAEAQAEAEKIVKEAKERVDDLLGDRELLKAAQEEGARMVEEARKEATEIRKEADEYAISILSQLEDQLVAVQTTVRNGLEYLQGPAREEGRSFKDLDTSSRPSL
jgi:cell division septum initiation protein DivIVA